MTTKFGSVAWQNEMITTIANKMFNGETLTSEEKTFMQIQQEHNQRTEARA